MPTRSIRRAAPTVVSAPRRAALRPLPRSFFDRDPRQVAPELLGKLLVRREDRRLLAGRLVEVEAYCGLEDPAAHSYNGQTPRNAVLFGPAGHAYVYFIYGTHFCANISCQGEGEPGCILLRALEPVLGVEQMAAARGIELDEDAPPGKLRMISTGPGRLCAALGITRPRDNGKDLCSPRSDLFVADDGWRPEKMLATPRVGINPKNPALHEPLRYIIAGNEFVSAPRR